MADLEHPAATGDKDDMAADRISGWIVKAIEDGHYTVEQIELLTAQKRKVNETIAALEQSLQFQNGHIASSSQAGASTSLLSVKTNQRPPLRTFAELLEPKRTLPVAEQPTTLRTNIFPECRWSSCHTCRPTFRDRAWQSLEGVLARNTPEQVSTAYGERRVTDVNIARKLGLRKPHTTFDSFEDLRSETSEEDDGVFHGRPSGRTDGEGEGQEDDSKGFRTSVKRAFRGMLMSRRRYSDSSSVGKKSWRKSSNDGGETEDFDVGLWTEMNSQLLREAAEVRSPGGAGMDGHEFEEGEVEVKEGVAVTEEAVDLGMADVIISV